VAAGGGDTGRGGAAVLIDGDDIAELFMDIRGRA
jgi:hypothetical protein